MKLVSSNFENGKEIPNRHSKDGGNVSPALEWSGIPDRARSLALMVDDPDAPQGTFVHWLLCGLSPESDGLPEGAGSSPPRGVRGGRNGFGEIGYGGPKPPSGTHRYFFHLYALDKELDLPQGFDRQKMESAMREHILATAELFGVYTHRESDTRAA
jgi:Raf kinase inhibitor-like YbhB/YbcL family protein